MRDRYKSWASSLGTSPPSHTARLVRAVLPRRFMGPSHLRTAPRRTKPATSRTPAALPSDLHAKRSAWARLFPGFPGLNRLWKRPAYAGALRLLDVGEKKGSIFPP
jgi:hypothetical protein